MTKLRGRRVGDNTGSGLTSWRGTNPGPRTHVRWWLVAAMMGDWAMLIAAAAALGALGLYWHGAFVW